MYESRHSNSVNSLICVQQVFQPLKSNFSTEVTLCPLVSFTASSLWSVCACHEHFPTLIYYKQCHIRLLCASMCRLSVRKCTESFQKLPFPRLEVMTFWKYHNLATKAAGASVWKSTVIPHSLLVPVSERYIKKKNSSHLMCSELEVLYCNATCRAAGSGGQRGLQIGAGLWPDSARHERRLNPPPTGRLIWD